MLRRPLGILAALLLGVGLVAPAVADEIPDPTDPTAQLSIEKTADVTEVAPGETFTYTIEVGCSAIEDVGCRGAITTDVIPEPLEIVNVTVAPGSNTNAPPVIDGQNVRVDWTTDIDGGAGDAIGLLDNSTVQINIEVEVPEDVSADLDGTTLTNNAVAEATNALDVTDSVDVTLNVPLSLDTTPTKTFNPTQTLAAEGTPVTASLTGTNDSNATVNTLVIQDPTDPTATPNPFTLLAFSSFGTITAPTGATATSCEVFVNAAWQSSPCDGLPPGMDPADVMGTRVTFTGAIPPDATGSVTLNLETTAEAAGVTEDTTVTNTVQSEVTLDGESATGTASANFLIQAINIEAAATKAFDPDLVIAGQPSTVTLGARNDSPFAIGSLTITEPSTGSFPPEYTFGGFTGGITYPAGATSGTVVYHFADGTTEEVDFANGATPADPTTGDVADVTSFEVIFTGEIASGAETSIPFEVNTDPDLDPADLPTTVTNVVAVQGELDGATADATASDDLFIYDEVIEPYIDKQVRPSQILAAPGQVVTVTMQGGTTERPNPPDDPEGTTGDADVIVIQDPQDPVEPNAWWNVFDLDSITQTPIPADSELNVYYYDTTTDEWVLLDGPIQGADIYSADVPADVSEVAGGIRFEYVYTGDAGGFAPGTDLAPNFTATTRDTGRYDGETPPYNTDPDEPHTFIDQCAQTTASSPTPGVPDGTAVMEPPDCPEVELIPIEGGPGEGDLIEKEYGTSSSGGNKSVIARSGDTIPSTLFWSTGGFSGFETVEITDVADETIPIADSVYDAFNLVSVEPITPDTDPYIQYDQITAVQLWIDGAWIDAANDPCPGGCDGTFPGMALTPEEQESATSVRLIFAESPTRVGPTPEDPDAPPVGSGVARSFGNDRQVTLTWQVRDTKRSDGSPALGEDTYNQPDPGVVRNTADATGFPADGDPISDTDFDDVVITDVPITTTTDKIWRGGPLAVPSPGTPPDQYPVSEMTVTTTNTTPARVDQLQITDPAPGSTTPPEGNAFNWTTLVLIDTITVPPGTDTTQVFLSCPDGTSEEFTRDEALALTPATMPCEDVDADGVGDVVGVQVLFDGRIAAGGQGVLSLDMRLRADRLDTGAPITEDDSPIGNTAEGIVADVAPIGDCPPPADARYACDQGTATIELVAPTFGIEAGKTITPASQTEGDFGPVTVTVSAQNNGSARPFIDTITDDDPTFWNAVDFQQMDPSWALPEPVEFVQACYLSGGNFTAANVEADTVGGTWTCQELPPGPPFEPGDLSLEEARAFINDAAATVDIHGLEFNFMAGDEIGWQNPANPLIEVPFQVERRVDLRTGGPVPTTRSDQTAAPGEENAGIFVDTVEVAGQSVLVGPDERLTDEDTADDDYTHDHLNVGVAVDKQPQGEVQPGVVIPFTLTYTNTGERALTNPVFTDVLPSDDEGNMLIFDPDSDPAINSPYSFELTGAPPDPPSGPQLPTDQDQITITEAGDTITFEMPDGSVLEVGQTYTITIDMMLRPGLSPDDVLVNTDQINADEPFDPENCSPNYTPDNPATPLVDEEACWDDTTINPIAVAALATTKWVKADVPVEEEGIPEVWLDRGVLPPDTEVPDDFCDTAADDEGFYRSPCVPVTYPGDTETWKFNLTNVGTLPMDEVVATDNLPFVGDTGMIVTLPRDSEWEPTFVDDVTFDIASEGATPTTFYSTSGTPCLDELNDPINGQCAEGEWLPYVEGTTDPADVASLMFKVDFADADLFDPAETMTISFTTRTTPTELTPDSEFPVAWNTVASGGTYDDDQDVPTAITATEGRKVGITYPTGPIQLEKVVSGPGAEFAPDEFTVQPTCTVDPDATPIDGLDEVTLDANGDPVGIDGLPWGSECTATETDQGQTTVIIGTATVGGPQDPIGLVTVNNFFGVGGMSVTKTVTTDAVDQDGTPITYGPFTVRVDCTFLGEPVFADGFDADNPMVAELDDGESFDLTGLPVGAECTTTEPDDADADQVTITPAQPVEIEVGPTQVEVTVDNQFDVGALELVKEVEGAALTNDPSLAEGPFTLHVTCTLTDASRPAPGTTVYDADVVLQGADGEPPLPETIENLPSGAVCDIEETDTGGATSHTIDPQQVTIGDDPAEPVTVTATNVFEASGMTVTKAVDSDAVDQDGTPITYGPFQAAVTCVFRGQTVLADGFDSSPMEFELADGATQALNGLPVGATCVTTEPDSADAVDTTIEPNPVVIGGDDQDPSEVQAVTVTNEFTVGSLALTKESEGGALDNNPELAEGPFTLHVTCTLTDASHPDGTTVYDDDVVLEGDSPQSDTIDNLPTGAECTVTEPDQGGATSVEIEGSPATIGVDTTGPVTVTATNTFAVGNMAVTKAVTTDAVDQDGNPIAYGPFQVSVTCELAGQEVVADGFDASPMEVTIADGETVTLTSLPVGAECTTTEPGSADAVQINITPEQPVLIPEPGAIGVPQTVEVDVENVYEVGSLRLRKAVFPDAVQEFPISEGPYTLHVSCTLTDASHPDGEVVYEDDIVLQGPQPLTAQIDNIAAGAVCTVTEPDDGAANAHVIVPRQQTIRADRGPDRPLLVVATNFFGRGSLTVTKTVDGPGADLYGAGPFEVSVECTYTDVNGEQQPLNTPGGPTRELTADNDYTATYDPLLFGSTCTIEETGTGGATETVITDADGEEVSEFTIDSLTEAVRLDVTNTFGVGRVRVHKTVTGDGSGPYEVRLACTQDVDGEETRVAVPGGGDRTLSEGSMTTTYADLPVGAECTLRETDDGGARATTITPNDGDPSVGTVTVEDGATVTFEVENEFDPAVGPGDEGDEGPGGLLPGTGAPRGLLALVIAGLALLAAGALLIERGRRGRRT